MRPKSPEVQTARERTDAGRHAEEVDRLRHTACVVESLEERERFLVAEQCRGRLLEIDVPVCDAIEAARDQQRSRWPIASRGACSESACAEARRAVS